MSGGVPFSRAYVFIPNAVRASGSDTNCGGVFSNVDGDEENGAILGKK